MIWIMLASVANAQWHETKIKDDSNGVAVVSVAVDPGEARAPPSLCKNTSLLPTSPTSWFHRSPPDLS